MISNSNNALFEKSKVMNTAKGSKVIADFSIMPIGHGETSIGRYVAAAISATNEVKGLKCEITSMGTIMEADSLETIFKAVKAAMKPYTPREY